MIDSVSILGYFIRPLLEKDISDEYLSWFDDDDVTRFLEVNKDNSITSIEDLIYYVRSFEYKKDYLFGIFHNKNHIGNLTINTIDINRGIFDMGYFIGNKNYWGERAGEAALVAGLRFAFEELKLRKIFGGIYSTNLSARFLSKKIGFIEEARLKEKGYVDGKLDDAIIYTMTKDQWKYIGKKYEFKF